MPETTGTLGTSGTARDRILETAGRLFYEHGFRAIGIDTIIRESGVAKMSLYNNFANKDDLVAAYLSTANEQFLGWWDQMEASTTDPLTQLQVIMDGIGDVAASPGCRGCSFTSASGEFPESTHVAHAVAIQHKNEVMSRLTRIAQKAKVTDPDALAAGLMLLIDGAWTAAKVYSPEAHHARYLSATARVLIAAAAAPVRPARKAVKRQARQSIAPAEQRSAS